MTYETLTQDLSQFRDREKNLRAVTRYSLYSVMWYRTNLWSHSRRVAWIVEKLIPFAQKEFGGEFDADKAIALSLVHDDAETLFGDIQAGNKSKMSKEELEHVASLERDAIDTLAKKSPSHVGKYEYKTLLLLALDKSELESIVVDWADKLDAFGEALHEVFAGNAVWTKNVVNEYGRIPLPTEYYMTYFNNFTKKFPKSVGLFQQEHSLFKIPLDPNISMLIEHGLPHTAQSIQNVTGYEPYDFWVQLTLENGTEEDIENLYLRKE